MLSCGVRPSVRPIRSCIASKRVNIGPLFSNFFSRSGSHTILAFPYHALSQYSNGDPTNGVERMYENRVFRTTPISRFVSEMVQDWVIVTMKYYKELTHAILNGINSNDLE